MKYSILLIAILSAIGCSKKTYEPTNIKVDKYLYTVTGTPTINSITITGNVVSKRSEGDWKFIVNVQMHTTIYSVQVEKEVYSLVKVGDNIVLPYTTKL